MESRFVLVGGTFIFTNSKLIIGILFRVKVNISTLRKLKKSLPLFSFHGFNYYCVYLIICLSVKIIAHKLLITLQIFIMMPNSYYKY